MEDEIHEHPLFDGQYHKAIWMKKWASTGTNDKAPDDALVTCAICGKAKEAE